MTSTLVVLVHREAWPAGDVEVRLTLPSQSAWPCYPPITPTPPNRSVGGVALLTFSGEVWPLDFVKMLDPSGCFYFTIPRIAVRVLVGLK